MSKRHPPPDWAQVRLDLYLRSGGRCEFCGGSLNNQAQVHHRKMRSQGGDHSMVNLALVHVDCHRQAHMFPAMAYDMGWLVRGSADPAEVPITKGPPDAYAARGS